MSKTVCIVVFLTLLHSVLSYFGSHQLLELLSPQQCFSIFLGPAVVRLCTALQLLRRGHIVGVGNPRQTQHHGS